MGFQEKLTEEITKVYTQNFDLLFPEVPVQINREIIIYENAFSVIGLISYWIKSDFMYSAQYMTEQMLKIAVFKHSSKCKSSPAHTWHQANLVYCKRCDRAGTPGPATEFENLLDRDISKSILPWCNANKLFELAHEVSVIFVTTSTGNLIY